VFCGLHATAKILPVGVILTCRNRSGTIDRAEFRQGLGDLGPEGEALKDFVFNRVDRLTESKGQLDVTDFANALTLARVVILGY
jgi:hypothetical protein